MARASGDGAPVPAGTGGLSRREVLGRAAALAVAGPVAAALSACGDATSEAGASARLVAIGDWGSGSDSAAAVAAAVRRVALRERVNALVTVGDNNYADSAAAFEDHWRRYYGWVRPAGIQVSGALGNHDVTLDGGRYEFATLGMPGRYYRRTFGPVDLIVLDSNDVDDGQTRWLGKALRTSRKRWKIPVFHHPVHTCGRYEAKRFDVRRWVPLFERAGVPLVLNGHDHNYQRLEAGPVTYVVVGGGGAKLYDLRECPEAGPVSLAGESQNSFLYLQATEERVDAAALAPDGQILDRFSVT